MFAVIGVDGDDDDDDDYGDGRGGEENCCDLFAYSCQQPQTPPGICSIDALFNFYKVQSGSQISVCLLGTSPLWILCLVASSFTVSPFQLMFTCSFSLQNEWTDNVIGFHMPTYRACKNLWKTCVEYHTFYRFVSNGYVINFLKRAFKVVCLKLESVLLSLKISRFPPFNFTPRFGKRISLSNC